MEAVVQSLHQCMLDVYVNSKGQSIYIHGPHRAVSIRRSPLSQLPHVIARAGAMRLL